MNLSNTALKQIFLNDDILPIGKFETVPVSHQLDGNPCSYPDVTIIMESIDFASLATEAIEHMKITGNNYVAPRIKHLNPAIDEKTLRNVLADVGFFKGSYQSFSLRKLGTNELEDWVLPATRKLITSLPVLTFRQQYAVAAPGWNTKLHRDHSHFGMHGFRAMVPLSADVYMGYSNSLNENIVYRLERGKMYFVNIAKMHRGFNESNSVERINLIMQMDSDKMLFPIKLLTPMSSADMGHLPIYATEYTIWEFGNEL